MSKTKSGFTLVELLIVIVIIAILAAITIIAYNGIQNRAIISQQQSDLNHVSQSIEMYNVDNGSYPSTIAALSGLGIKFSSSPVGSNVLACYSADGYAIFVRQNASAADGQYIVKGSAPMATSSLFSPGVNTGSYWSGSILCAKTPYANSAWGSTWVSGG